MFLTAPIQPDIFIGGIRIQEPVTTFTDFVIAVACIYAWYKIRRINVAGNTMVYLRWYFILMGFATVFGGLFSHAFKDLVDPHFKLIGWFISMIAVMLIERSSIEHAKQFVKPALHKGLLILNLIELTIFMTLAAVTLSFKFVEYHSVYGFLGVVFSFQLITYVKSKDIGSKYVLWAIGLLAVSMFIYDYPIVPHVWFNNADCAHVLMTVSTLLVLKGALKFNTYPEGASQAGN
jgi:hypothetical protein